MYKKNVIMLKVSLNVYSCTAVCIAFPSEKLYLYKK
jgi:hypothetical protein